MADNIFAPPQPHELQALQSPRQPAQAQPDLMAPPSPQELQQHASPEAAQEVSPQELEEPKSTILGGVSEGLLGEQLTDAARKTEAGHALLGDKVNAETEAGLHRYFDHAGYYGGYALGRTYQYVKLAAMLNPVTAPAAAALSATQLITQKVASAALVNAGAAAISKFSDSANVEQSAVAGVVGGIFGATAEKYLPFSKMTSKSMHEGANVASAEADGLALDYIDAVNKGIVTNKTPALDFLELGSKIGVNAYKGNLTQLAKNLAQAAGRSGDVGYRAQLLNDLQSMGQEAAQGFQGALSDRVKQAGQRNVMQELEGAGLSEIAHTGAQEVTGEISQGVSARAPKVIGALKERIDSLHKYSVDIEKKLQTSYAEYLRTAGKLTNERGGLIDFSYPLDLHAKYAKELLTGIESQQSLLESAANDLSRVGPDAAKAILKEKTEKAVRLVSELEKNLTKFEDHPLTQAFLDIHRKPLTDGEHFLNIIKHAEGLGAEMGAHKTFAEQSLMAIRKAGGLANSPKNAIALAKARTLALDRYLQGDYQGASEAVAQALGIKGVLQNALSGVKAGISATDVIRPAMATRAIENLPTIAAYNASRDQQNQPGEVKAPGAKQMTQAKSPADALRDGL